MALRGKYHAYEDQSGNPFRKKLLAATVIAGIDNATVAQHLALNDATLDTYPKIKDAVRSFVRASRSWNVSADGDPMDVDAMTKGKARQGKAKDMRKERVQRMRAKTQRTAGRTENVSTVRPNGHVAKHCKKRINDEKAKAGQLQHDNSKGNQYKCEITRGSTGNERVKSSSREHTVISRVITSPQSSATCSNVCTDGKTSCSNSISTSCTM